MPNFINDVSPAGGKIYGKDAGGNPGFLATDNIHVNNRRYEGHVLSSFYNRPATDYQVTGAGSSVAVSTSVTRSGTQTIALALDRGSATNTDFDIIHSWANPVIKSGRVGCWVYISDFTKLSSMVLKVSHGDTSFTNGAYQTYSFADGDKKFNGWHFVGFDKSEFAGSWGTPNWDTTVNKVRLTCNQASADPITIYLDALVASWSAKAKLLITADDGYASWFSYAIPILNSFALKSTAAIIGAQIDNGATWATTALLSTAHSAGHDMCPHGATALTDPSFTDDAARLADIVANRNFLINAGLTGCTDFYVYPGGAYLITGAENQIIDLLKANGFRAARGTTQPRYLKHAPGVSDSKWIIPQLGVTATTSAATFQSLIDAAITCGATASLMYHEILLSGASGVTQRNLADFMQDINYVAQKRDAGLLDVVTASEWMGLL